jgi:hypothetical protein
MNEEEWEALLMQADLRAVKFGELLETLADHPQRDAQISHDMGWNEDETEASEEERQAWEEMRQAMQDAAEEIEERQRLGLPLEDEEGRVEDIPAYAAALTLELQIVKALKLLPSHARDEDEALADALVGMGLAAAKIAGGHGLGYDDESICGNIVNNKRALAGVRQCRRGLTELRDDGRLDKKAADVLLDECRRVEELIAARIEDLRARVWW